MRQRQTLPLDSEYAFFAIPSIEILRRLQLRAARERDFPYGCQPKDWFCCNFVVEPKLGVNARRCNSPVALRLPPFELHRRADEKQDEPHVMIGTEEGVGFTLFQAPNHNRHYIP